MKNLISKEFLMGVTTVVVGLTVYHAVKYQLNKMRTSIPSTVKKEVT